MRFQLPKTHYERFCEINQYVCDLLHLPFKDIFASISKFELLPDVISDMAFTAPFAGTIPDAITVDKMGWFRQIMFHCYFFWKYKKIYYFEKEITEILQNTSLKGLDVDFIQIPHAAIYLSIPNNTELVTEDLKTGSHILEGIYVYCRKITPDFLEIIKQQPSASNIPIDAKYFFRYMVVGKNKPEFGEYDDAVFFNTIFLRAGDIFEQLENNLMYPDHYFDEKIIPSKNQIGNMRRIHSFIVNAILYIMSSQARIEIFHTELKNPYTGTNAKKMRHANKDNKGCSKIPEFNYVGRGFRPTGTQTTGTGHKITVKFKVKSHWHTYWIGEGRTERKLNLLAEYAKGSDLAETLEKNIAIVR